MKQHFAKRLGYLKTEMRDLNVTIFTEKSNYLSLLTNNLCLDFRLSQFTRSCSVVRCPVAQSLAAVVMLCYESWCW